MLLKNCLKSFVLLIVFNSGTLSLLFYLFPVKYLTLNLVFLVILNTYLLFFSDWLFIKTLQLKPILPTDSSGIHAIWEEWRKNTNSQRGRCYIFDSKLPLSLHFSHSKEHFAVFSKGLLELLTKEEMKALVCYCFTSFLTGWSLFLTLISYFCLLVFWLCFILEAPVRILRKNKKPILFPWFLKTLGFITRRIFLHLDKKTHQTLAEKSYPHTLWKVQSLYKVDIFSVPAWMAPVFFGNPLTWKTLKWYVFFQPKIRQRVKALTGSYPP